METSHDMLAHGVYIVTARHDGKQAGMACAWATQLAKDKVLACIGVQSWTRDLILASGAFGLSVLAKDQADIGRRFGTSSSKDTDKFAGIETHTSVTGSPLLKDCGMWLDCRVEQVFDPDPTHKIIVGKVVATGRPRPKYERLIYIEEEY